MRGSLLLAGLALLLCGGLEAQDAPPPAAVRTDPGPVLPLPALDAPSPREQGFDLGPLGRWDVEDLGWFTAGMALGLVIHESGHLAVDYALNAHPKVEGVKGGGIPFFAITPQRPLTDRQAYLVSSAGLMVQFASAEVVLARHPHLWEDEAPVAKGVFAFHLLTSFIYSYAAFRQTGPEQRDTLGIAKGRHVREPLVGAVLLVPALLDLYRSFHPEAAWAKWSSRSVKLGFAFTLTR